MGTVDGNGDGSSHRKSSGQGWFPDQVDTSLERFFDGDHWTDRTRPIARQGRHGQNEPVSGTADHLPEKSTTPEPDSAPADKPKNNISRMLFISLAIAFVLIMGLVSFVTLNKQKETTKVSSSTVSSQSSSVLTPMDLTKYVEDLDMATLYPNSANGVEVRASFTNVSGKSIDYITFKVAPFNAVGDMVSSSIGSKTYANIKITGPIANDAKKTAHWDPIWYNSTIKYLKLYAVEIEYSNGTTTTIEYTNPRSF